MTGHTMVVGASRGLGRGVARAFADAGDQVLAVSRTAPALALLQPLPPGSRVVVMSSGAAVNGSPASGGYAGAKATQRFIAAYAQEESCRAALGTARQDGEPSADFPAPINRVALNLGLHYIGSGH